MTTIDRYSTVGNTPNLQDVQPLPDTTGVKATQAGQPEAPGADDLAYLRTDGNAPVPAFAGAAQVDHDQHGKAALRVMHENVRADMNGLTSSWQGAGFSDPTGAGVGINYSELIEVLVKLDSEQAKISREQHTWEYKQIAQTDLQAADDTRTAGHLEFVGKMVGSSLTMAAGTAQAAGGAYAAASEGAGAGSATEAAGEGGTGESNVSSLEEGETSAPVTESVTSGGDMETGESAPMNSEETSVEDTEEMQAELEEAASEAQSGDAVEGTEEATSEQRVSEQSGQKDERVFDDDTKKMMRQFSKDARANVSAQSSQAKLAISGGIAQGFQGIGSAGEGIGNLGASEYRARAKEDEAAAAEQRAVAQRELDYGKSAEENAKKMMDVYDAIAQSRNASMERVLSA